MAVQHAAHSLLRGGESCSLLLIPPFSTAPQFPQSTLSNNSTNVQLGSSWHLCHAASLCSAALQILRSSFICLAQKFQAANKSIIHGISHVKHLEKFKIVKDVSKMSEGWFRSVIGEICVFLFPAVNSSDWWTSLVFNRQTANSGFTDEISNREHDSSWNLSEDNYFLSITFLTFWDLSNKRKAWKDETRARRKTRVTKHSKKYLFRGPQRGFLVCSHLQ